MNRNDVARAIEAIEAHIRTLRIAAERGDEFAADECIRLQALVMRMRNHLRDTSMVQTSEPRRDEDDMIWA